MKTELILRFEEVSYELPDVVIEDPPFIPSVEDYFVFREGCGIVPDDVIELIYDIQDKRGDLCKCYSREVQFDKDKMIFIVYLGVFDPSWQ